MTLPLVSPFATPYDAHELRRMSFEEAQAHARQTGEMTSYAKTYLRTITSAREAAAHMLLEQEDNALENYIDRYLDRDAGFQAWRKTMPSRTPGVLSDYQNEFPTVDLHAVDTTIHIHGTFLPEGQLLFHGGSWPTGYGSPFTTTRPFSTSLCPQVALRNAEFQGKAYDARKVELFVIRVQRPSTKAFVFRTRGTRKGHEKEVLFASGTTLQLRSRTMIRNNYPVNKYLCSPEHVPAYVLDVDIA